MIEIPRALNEMRSWRPAFYSAIAQFAATFVVLWIAAEFDLPFFLTYLYLNGAMTLVLTFSLGIHGIYRTREYLEDEAS